MAGVVATSQLRQPLVTPVFLRSAGAPHPRAQRTLSRHDEPQHQPRKGDKIYP